MKDEEIRKAVREGYGKIAEHESSCCGPTNTCGCACGSPQDTVSRAIGYTDDQLGAIPGGANLGLGCGNPTALASLKKGEVVLDLGSGGGIDCFLAANAVGGSGMVIGVDMSPEMLERARENARTGGYHNVEFRLGEIENLPVADNSVDAVISNCVINLSPDKSKVFKEAYRALKPGGRIMISDIALLKELPSAIKNSVEAYVGCVAGATTKQEYLAAVEAAGFREVEVVNEVRAKAVVEGAAAQALAESLGTAPGAMGEAVDSIVSMVVQAVKPN
jgi:ubiquinone/menaquinone biosynthesis C-methylase UbiE